MEKVVNAVESHIPRIAKDVTDLAALINKWRGAGLELHALHVKSHVPLEEAQAMRKRSSRLLVPSTTP